MGLSLFFVIFGPESGVTCVTLFFFFWRLPLPRPGEKFVAVDDSLRMDASLHMESHCSWKILMDASLRFNILTDKFIAVGRSLLITSLQLNPCSWNNNCGLFITDDKSCCRFVLFQISLVANLYCCRFVSCGFVSCTFVAVPQHHRASVRLQLHQ